VDVITDANRSASQWRRKEREGSRRPGLDRVGADSGVCDLEPSRAGRDLAIYVQLRAACQRAGVLYLTQGRVYDFSRPDDSFMMGFEFLRAEADANTMRERQLRTARRNAEKGRPHGRLAYGYRRCMTSGPGCSFVRSPTRIPARSSGTRHGTCWRERACGRWRCGCRTRVSRRRCAPGPSIRAGGTRTRSASYFITRRSPQACLPRTGDRRCRLGAADRLGGLPEAPARVR